MTPLSPVLAHGSGIDDVLWFVVPVVLAVVLLRAAERRSRRRAEQAEAQSDPEHGAGG